MRNLFAPQDVLAIAGVGAAAAAMVGLLGLALLRVLRRRSTRAALVAVAVASIFSVLAGVVAAARAMFLSRHDFGVVLLASVPGGAVAIGVALVLGRRVVAGGRALQEATRALGEGRTVLPQAREVTSDLTALSRQLGTTSALLAESRERERALEASRRELVAWVSHDLRTPLAGLRAMAEALEDGVASDPARYHREMRVQVDELAALVDDLFELSRIHAGALRLAIDHVSVSDLISDLLAGADPVARARGVRLRGGADVSTPVPADSREISRALGNLVVNAIRHTPTDGSVEVQATEQDGEVVVAVQDACGGIPEPDLERVFDVAWRGTHARTPGPGSGAGLGLAIVRGIVEAHRGHVSVVNVAGGCRFEVRLPLAAGGGP